MNRYDQFAVVQKQWAAPRELGHSVPRPVQLSAGGMALAVLAGALVVGAMAGAALAGRQSVRQKEDYSSLERDGVRTDARINRLWRTSGEGKHYRAEYSFAFEGRTYRKEIRVPNRVWSTLHQGGPLPVRFDLTNPNQNHPVAWNRRPLSIWVAILIPACLIPLAWLCVFVLRREMDLLAEGRAAPAVVTKLEHGESTVIHYELRLISGGIVTGKSGASRKGVQPGMVLNAIYDPNNPRRRALYPLSLVRVPRS